MTKFLLLYVVSRLLTAEEFGTEAYKNPSVITGEAAWQEKLMNALRPILSSLIIDLNYEIDRDAEGFDYKTELKSPNRVRERADELLKSYEKEVVKGKLDNFERNWLLQVEPMKAA